MLALGNLAKKSMNKAPNTFWHVKQFSDNTVNRLTVVKLNDVKQLTLNILLNVYLFGNAEVFISQVLGDRIPPFFVKNKFPVFFFILILIVAGAG
jgi:hypothetical protein